MNTSTATPDPTAGLSARPRRYLIGLVAFASVVAACGGSGNEESATVRAEPAPAAEADDPTLDIGGVEDGAPGGEQVGEASSEPGNADAGARDTDDSNSSNTDANSTDTDTEGTDAEATSGNNSDGDATDPGDEDVPEPDDASSLGRDIVVQRYAIPFVPPITLPDVSVLSETGAAVKGSLGSFAGQESGLDVLGAECSADGGELVYSGTDDAGSFFDVDQDGSGTYELTHGPDGNIDITVNADGSGTYDLVHGREGNISIVVNADGSGTYEHVFSDDGNLEIEVAADGTGTYSRALGADGNVEIEIAADGSGSYEHVAGSDGNIELTVNADGTGRYEHTLSAQGNIKIVADRDGSRRYEQTLGPDGNIDIIVNADGSGSYEHFGSSDGNIDISVDSAGSGVYKQTFGPNGNVETTFTTDVGILDPELVIIGPEPTFAVADSFPPLAQLAPLQPPCATVIRLDASVLFDFDSAELRPEAAPVVAEVAAAVIANDKPLEVNGHTDSIGDDSYNQDLSERRATSFAEALVDSGVEVDITIAGFGESRPAAPNTTPSGADNPAGRQLNRRIEVVIGGEK